MNEYCTPAPKEIMGCFIEGASNSYRTNQASLRFGHMPGNVDLNYGSPIEVETA